MDIEDQLQTQINEAAPLELIVMLYDGAIRFVEQAQKAMRGQNFEEAGRFNQRAQDILAELNSTLDLSYGEIAQRLSLLYEFYQRQLILANLKKDPELLNPVLNFLQEYRVLWAEANQKLGEVV